MKLYMQSLQNNKQMHPGINALAPTLLCCAHFLQKEQLLKGSGPVTARVAIMQGLYGGTALLSQASAPRLSSV